METDRKWIVVWVDGKIAAISTDYKLLAQIAGRLSKASEPEYTEVRAEAVGLEDIWRLRIQTGWEDMILFGTDFQKKVWRKLWELTHKEDSGNKDCIRPALISYSDFAGLCQNRAGVRAVAHAIGLNPVSVVIPCHLVVPKEAIDKINSIHRKAEATIFKGDDLCIDNILKDQSTDFGNYALGRELKRTLIQMEFKSR